MYADTTAMTFWMDLQDITFTGWAIIEMVLEISLTDYPDVIPVYQRIDVTPTCPDFVQDIKTVEQGQQNINYDVTEASTIQTFNLGRLHPRNWGCFSSTLVEIVDSNGDPVSFTSVTSPLDQIGMNYLYLDLSGVQMWSWLTTTFTLHWNVEFNEGTRYDDLLVVTV